MLFLDTTIDALILDKVDIAVEIEHNDDTTYTLRWSDGVANTWEETYHSLAVTLLRLAALAECGRLGWIAGFAHSEREFGDVAERFLSKAVQ